MEYRLTVTIAEHGASEEVAERILDALVEVHPETGPVVSQDLTDSTLTITVAIEATDPWTASTLGSRVVGGTLEHLDLPMTEVLDVCVSALDQNERAAHVHRDKLVRV